MISLIFSLIITLIYSMLARFYRFLNVKHIGPGDSKKRSVMLQCFPFDTRNNDMFLFQKTFNICNIE